MDWLTGSVVIAGGIVLLTAAVLGGWAIGVFNNLVQVRNNADKAFKNIDVLLLERHDELTKLVEACRAFMAHERGLFEDLVRLRESYDRAGSAQEKIDIENRINRQWNGLAGRWEAYPDLKSSQSFLQIQGRISALESSIADRREFFNDSTNIYNIQIERFPDLLLARLLHYDRRSFLEVPAAARLDVKLDLASTPA
jgi:LemA protein